MSMRRVVLAVAASLLLLVPLGAAPAVAKKAPSANKQVNRAFTLLVRDTRARPQARGQQEEPCGARCRTAKTARKQARRRPCASIRTLRTYNRQLKRVRVRKHRTRDRRPTAGSPRGRSRLAWSRSTRRCSRRPKAKRCGGGSRNARDRGEVHGALEHREAAQDADPAAAADSSSSHQVGGKDFLEMAMEGMDVSGDIGRPRPPDEEHLLRHSEGRERRRRREQRQELHDPRRRAVSAPGAAGRPGCRPARPMPTTVRRPAVRDRQQGLRLEGQVPVVSRSTAAHSARCATSPPAPSSTAGGQYRAEDGQAEGVHVHGRDGQLRRRQQGHVRRLGPAEPLEPRLHRRLPRRS